MEAKCQVEAFIAVQLRGDGGPGPKGGSSEAGQKDFDSGSTLKIDSVGNGDRLDVSHELEESKALGRFYQTERVELLHLRQELL